MTHPRPGRAAAPRLDKITFGYRANEDRLLARLQTSDGEHQALWLTQRIARRLVIVIRSHLEKTIPAERHSVSDRRAASTASTPEELLLSFRHQAAILRRQSTSPVPDFHPTDAPLLQAIEIQTVKDRVLLTIDLPTGPVIMPLSQDHAWQLLQILLDVFYCADWPVDAWPEWMRKGDRSTHAPAICATRPLH